MPFRSFSRDVVCPSLVMVILFTDEYVDAFKKPYSQTHPEIMFTPVACCPVIQSGWHKISCYSRYLDFVKRFVNLFLHASSNRHFHYPVCVCSTTLLRAFTALDFSRSLRFSFLDSLWYTHYIYLNVSPNLSFIYHHSNYFISVQCM